MLKTLVLSFRLRNAYKTNSILWALKGIPLVRKLLPSRLYASRGLKTFANVVSGILEVMSAFLGKLLYLFLVWTLSRSVHVSPSASFAHVLLFTTVIGGILNTYIFEPTKDKYYAMFLLRMNARDYTLTNYFYFLLKMLAGFTVFSLVFGRMLGASVLTCLCVPVYVVGIKLCFTAVSLNKCDKREKTYNENQFTPLVIGSVLLLLALALVPPFLGYVLPEQALWFVTLLLLVPAGFSFRRIVTYPSYRQVYQDLLRPSNIFIGAGRSSVGAAQQLALQKRITADMSATSNKSGYRYFNELFMKRHARLLTRSAKRITLGAAALFAAAAATLILVPSARDEVNKVLMTCLPYFLFIMYMINRGRTITQAMFMNCDHSMLTFRFYRQPRALLALFTARLKNVILINLMPASVIALGLPLLLFLSGGTPEKLNYLVLFTSILSMSVFFSVHSMVMYYLLQPYNVNLESKSAAYGIVNWVTYMVSYLAIQIRVPTLVFGSAISAFCLVYVCIAVFLAYRLAPKTFRLRN